MKKYTRDEIIADLIDYATNMPHPILDSIEGIDDILCEFEREWTNAPCDAEGPTKEQDKELDRILDKYADEIENAERVK